MQTSQQTVKALQQAISKEEQQQILKHSQALIKDNPHNLQYKQCYAITAIKSKLFHELSIGIFKDKPQEKALERIFFYYLYASGQYNKCIEAISNTKDQGLQLLLAQAYFKTLDYQKSMQIMSSLLKVVKVSKEDKELYMVNFLATATPLNQPKIREFQFLITDTSCKEMFYNFSLFLFSIGECETALKFLTSFEQALQKDDEIDRTTAKIFRDYIVYTTNGFNGPTKQNKIEEYKNLLKSTKDENLKCVISNNLIVLSGNHDSAGADYYKNIEQMKDGQNKMSVLQLVTLKINKLSYLNKKNRIHDSLKIIHQLEAQQSLLNTSQFYINKYFAFKKNKDFKSAETYARKIMQQNINLGFCLLVDLFIDANDTKSIVDSLESLQKSGNDHAKNYIFSLLIKDTNLFMQYSAYLDELIKKSTQLKTLEILLKLYENKQDKAKQVLILNRMLQINPKNSFARVGLAQICIQNNDVDKAEELLRGIDRPDQITDLNYLQYIQKNIHFSKKQDLQTVEEQKKSLQKKRIKKTKRVKLPKNVDKPTPGFKPDPERWLPKWQRKGYKKKGKKGGGNKTQGLSTVGMEEKNVYNASNSTSAKEVTKQSNKRRK